MDTTSQATISGIDTTSKDFLAKKTDALKKALRDVFFDTQKRKPEDIDGYLVYINDAQKIITRLKVLEVEEKKAEMLAELEALKAKYGAEFIITEKKKGKGKAASTSTHPNAGTKDTTPVAVKYLTETGEIKTFTVGGTDQITVKKFGKDAPELVTFWNWAKAALKAKTIKVELDGKPVYTMPSKAQFASMDDAVLKAQFAAYVD